MSDILNAAGDRLAKVISRSGLCSRRDAEGWIKDGRVTVNGRKVLTPAFNVTEKDKIKVDGEPLAARQGTRVWLYHKPAGLVVTEKDPEGRPTVFEALQDKDLPRVVSIGRLDINTEGLLLVTNDGGLKRVLELPATGWLRRYRVRAFGTVTQEQLDTLKDGIEIDGVQYGPIEAMLEREQGSNSWLVLGLREGKNREVKNVLGALGLQVNRLIRVSYGPFQLGDLAVGEVDAVPARVLRDQLGRRLAAEANTDFDSEMPEMAAHKRKSATNPKLRAAAPGQVLKADSPHKSRRPLGNFRFTDPETERADEAARAERPRQDRPGRTDLRPPKPGKPVREDNSETRRVLFDDGREEVVKVRPQRPGPARARDPEDGPARSFGRPGPQGGRPARSGRSPATGGADRPKRSFGDKPAFGEKRGFGDRPKRDFGDKPPFASRGPRPDGDRSAGGGYAGKKPYAPPGDGDRPAGGGYAGKKPYAPRGDGDRPAGGGYAGKKPYAPRGDGDRPAGGGYAGKKPYAPRGDGDRPAGGGYAGKKPYAPRGDGDRPAGGGFAGKKPYAPRGDGPRPGGSRPAGGRGKSGGGGGDRPRGPRKPRS